jgi:UDPglucose--hexose-1-phosphate uridylyltransferase
MAMPSEWRFDPFTGRRVLIAPTRGSRPTTVGNSCPFCEGNEHETTPEVFAQRTPGTAPNAVGWRVRVITNRYAAVHWYEETTPQLAHGVAELFIESAQHATRFEELPEALLTESLYCWRERVRFWAADGRVAFAQVFKNQGYVAGASLEHCHSQLMGVQIVPEAVQRECTLLHAHRVNTGDCLVCTHLAHEQHSARCVSTTANFAVWSPVAARFPGEMWIVPQQHQAFFSDLSDAELPELAALLRRIVRGQIAAFGGVNYNIVVKSAPFRTPSEDYHWRLELLPRTTGIAGWEWGTGVIINTMTPEDAAQQLRQALAT